MVRRGAYDSARLNFHHVIVAIDAQKWKLRYLDRRCPLDSIGRPSVIIMPEYAIQHRILLLFPLRYSKLGKPIQQPASTLPGRHDSILECVQSVPHWHDSGRGAVLLSWSKPHGPPRTSKVRKPSWLGIPMLTSKTSIWSPIAAACARLDDTLQSKAALPSSGTPIRLRLSNEIHEAIPLWSPLV